MFYSHQQSIILGAHYGTTVSLPDTIQSPSPIWLDIFILHGRDVDWRSIFLSSRLDDVVLWWWVPFYGDDRRSLSHISEQFPDDFRNEKISDPEGEQWKKLKSSRALGDELKEVIMDKWYTINWNITNDINTKIYLSFYNFELFPFNLERRILII